jgi:integrase
MSVRKRKWKVKSTGEERESWVVDYRDGEGSRVLRTFDRKKDADAFHATVRMEVDRGEHIAPSKSDTVAEAAERWIKRVEAEGRERSTVRQYRQHVSLHIGPRIGAIKLANLTAARVESFRDELLAELSRPLARKVLTSLKSILKVAKRGHVAASAFIGREKRAPRLEVGKDIPSSAEIKRLLAAAACAPLRVRALLVVAIFTGLRASELRGLRWKDVDLAHGEVRVRQRADRFNQIGAPKSESSVRTIDIGSRVVNVLKEWTLACPISEHDLVFPTSTGAIEHHKNMLGGLESVLVAAGLTDKGGAPKYGLHSLRHYFCSWCLGRRPEGRELPLKVVQVLMGHSSIVMTGDRYGHIQPSRNDKSELAAAEAALWA